MISKRLNIAAAAIFLMAPFCLMPGLAQQPDQQPEGPQRPPFNDPIAELRLTPEQRAQIRSIRQQMQDERADINRRLRASNQALEEALDSDNPDEALIEQHLRDVAFLQAAQMRMRILSEVKIRRILTPEQRSLWRELRRANQLRRERQLNNPGREGNVDPRRFPNRRNGLGPVAPRSDDLPGRARP